MSGQNKHKVFATITKVDDNGDGTIDVHGVASTETKDAQGETVTKGCMIDALPDYFAHGTGALRAMHQPIAAGYVYKAEVNAAGETEISAKVVDPVEVLKVTTGTYKGFSIGGKKVPGGYDAATKTISKMKLTEISLVDRPANPEATITMWKGEDMDIQSDETVVDVTVTKSGEEQINLLADIINKGDITPERIVELAKAEIAAKLTPAPAATVVDPVVVAKVEEPAPAATVVVPVEPVADPVVAKAAQTEDDIKKGMYSIRNLASILTDIQYLAQDSLYELKSEGDGSAVPAQIMAWLKDGVGILQAMTAEETAEMLANLAMLAPPTVVIAPDSITMADLELEIKKSLDSTLTIDAYIEAAKPYMDEAGIGKALFADGGTLAANKSKLTEVIAKAGARNSKGDAAKIQTMHDHSVELGAACGDTAKGATADDIKKVEGLEADIAKLTDERNNLTKRVKELEDQPAPSKAVLRVINKAEDIIDEDAKPADGPVMKFDGSIDQEATAIQEIKKMHQTGGVRLLR